MSRTKKESETRELPSERRRHRRVSTSSFSIDYSSGDTFLFAYLENISEMGIFIRSDSPMDVGTELRMRFPIDGQDPLLVEGEVLWINPYRESGDNLNPGMGVRFKRMTPELREQIVELVRTVAYLRGDDDDDDDDGN